MLCTLAIKSLARLSAATYYGVSGDSIDMCSVVFMIVYVPGTIITCYLLDNYGVRWGLIIAAVIQAAAAWLRYFSAKNDTSAVSGGYGILLSGSIIAGLVQPVFTNSPARLSSIWFSNDQRNIATTICSIANPIGIAIGQLLPQLLQPSGNGKSDDANAMAGIPITLLAEAIINTAVLVLALMFFEEKPLTPPSSTAAHHAESLDSEHRESSLTHLWNDTKELVSNKHFMLMLCGFMIGMAMFNALGTLIDAILTPCGYDVDAGIFGALLIGGGLIGSIVFGIALDCTKNFKFYLKLGTLLYHHA
jgi:FLVCR family MFS transporter 7